MPFNGSGTFNRLYSWVADAAAGLDISASRMDADTNDICNSGLDDCLTRDGQGAPSANLPMNGFRHTNCQNGVANTDYATVGQVKSAISNVRRVTALVAGAVNVATTDRYVLVDLSVPAAAPVNLPFTGGPYTIVDEAGNAALYNLTITPTAGITINGEPTLILNQNNEFVTLIFDGVSNYVSSQTNQETIVSVKDFGAVGDFTHDDTSAIQGAINSGAGAIYFPTGKYLVTTINPVSNQLWYGDGYANSELAWSATNQPTTQNMIPSTADLSNFAMDRMGFTGSLLSQTDPDTTGQNLIGIKIRAGSAQNIRITNCRVRQFGDQSKDGGAGIIIAPATGSGKIVQDIFIQDNVIEDNANVPGVYVAGDSTFCTSWNNVHVDRNTIRINTNYSDQNAIYLLCDTSLSGTLWSVDDNVIQAGFSIDTAIEVNYITNGSICRNKITATGAADLVGILLRANVQHVVVAENEIVNAGTGCTTTNGISLLRFNSGEVQRYIIVANNTIVDFGSNSGTAGVIQISSGSDTVQVIGNQTIGSNIRPSVGISIDNADQVNVSNNQIIACNLAVSLSANATPHSNITIENNKIEACGVTGSALIVTSLANQQLTNVVAQDNQAYNSVSGTTYFISPSFLTSSGNIVRNNICSLEEVNPSYFASVSWLSILEGSAVPGTVIVNSGTIHASFDITVTGAEVEGVVLGVSCSVSKGSLVIIADVTLANTVTVFLYNPTGSNITVTNPTWTVKVQNI